MGFRGLIICSIRKTPLAVIPIVILGGTALTNLLVREPIYSHVATLFVLVISILLSIYAYWYVNGIGIQLIQTDPRSDSPAQTHYFSDFSLEDNYTEFDAYVEIPYWMDKFTLEFDPDDPLEVGLWEVPDDYTENGNTIECAQNAHNFGFVLSIAPESGSLGTGDRQVRIEENVTEHDLASLTIKSLSDSGEGYRQEYESEV
jgi:hypothetical protein